MTERKRAPKRAVIFDFDGTLVDSFDYVFDFLQAEAKNPRNYTAAEREELRHMSMKRLALRLGVPVWRLLAVYFKGRRTMRGHMGELKAFDGMPEVIRQLHGAGYLLFIASSNSTRNIRGFLKREGLNGYFRAVRGGAGFTGKAQLIRQLLLRYRLPKGSVWFVGDEISDVAAAGSAGVHSLAVTWGFAARERLEQMAPDGGLVETPADIVRVIGA